MTPHAYAVAGLLALVLLSSDASAQEATSFDVVLTATGSSKIQVIKVVRELTGLGLKDAKDLVEAAPKVVRSGLSRADAQSAQKKLEAAGASVELRSAAAPAATTRPPAPAPEGASFDVVLTAVGSSKIQVIKVVRELTGLGLKDAKDLVEAAPKVVRSGVPRADAQSAQKKLEAAGAGVELRSATSAR
jgi:large subunit ribosomal protein L7/L12